MNTLDSADPPLAVDCLYVDRHRQLRCDDAGAASRLGDLLAAAPARLAPVHRSVHVRAAVCHQVAQRATHIEESLSMMQKDSTVTREDQGTGRLAGRAALSDPHPDQAGRPRDDRGAEMEEAVEWDGGGPGLVAQRDRLHRRDVQERREDDLRQGSVAEGPFRPLQFQSRRQRQARHRLPRGRQDQREGPEGSHQSRREAERLGRD